jgi:molecular chaperone GrpE
MEFHVVDKRHCANPDNVPVDAPAEEKPRYPTYVEELLARVTETERRFEERKKQFDEEIARTRARLEADYDRRLEIAKQQMLLPLLDVLDNLERAVGAVKESENIEGLKKGVALTVELFRSRLQAMGVEHLEVLAQPFDPNVSQAIGVIETKDPKENGIVLEEVLPGYKLGDQLLRPAQVRVGQ